MQVISQPKNHKYNCLFLPGLPGKVRHFACFDDITNTGGRIHWLQYSGTYESKGVSEFSISSSVKDIEQALEKLAKEGLPLVVVAYSYSTLLVGMIDYAKYTGIVGMVLFSPIQGLDTSSIDEDFESTIRHLLKEGDISVEISDWSGNALKVHSNANYEQFLDKICVIALKINRLRIIDE